MLVLVEVVLLLLAAAGGVHVSWFDFCQPSLYDCQTNILTGKQANKTDSLIDEQAASK